MNLNNDIFLFPSKIYYRSKIFVNLFANLYPIRTKTISEYKTPFFIIGSPRSGNTLLRVILSSHQNVFIPPEFHALPWLYKRYITYNFLPWEKLISILLGEILNQPSFKYWNINISDVLLRLNQKPLKDRNLATIIHEVYLQYKYEHDSSAIFWGDKTPSNTLYLNRINKIFPNAKYIHIIRDGRDVVNSLLRAQIYTDLGKACERWTNSLNEVNKIRKKISAKNYTEVYYEDLVLRPKREILRICEFLDIEFQNNMMNYHKNIDNFGDTMRSHHVNLKRPVNSDSIGKWKHQLTLSDQNKVNKNLTEFLKKYNYT